MSRLARAREVLARSGPRGVVASAAAVAGARRLLLLELPVSAGEGEALDPEHHLRDLSAEEAEAFTEAWSAQVVRERLDAGHRCVAMCRGDEIISAWWRAEGPAAMPYLGCDFDPGPAAIYNYDGSTAPAVRGHGAFTLAALLIARGAREEGTQRAFAAVLPENAPAYLTLVRAGYRPHGVIATLWGRGPLMGSGPAALALARPPHIAPPLASALRRLARPAGERVTGAWWGAVPQREPLTPRGDLHTAVLHHTAEPAASLRSARAEAEYMRGIEEGHLLRGWRAIGYHHVVMPSGRVFEGRPPEAMGAHVRGHNQGTIGIALAGDFEHERPTEAALRSLDRLLAEYAVPLKGHGELADTLCPGRNLKRAMSARSGSPEVEALTV